MATFKKKDLQDLVGAEGCDGLDVVQDQISGKARWAILYRLVFKDNATGRFYATTYRRAATEQQNEVPFEYSPDAIDCDEVRPVEKVVIVYERVAK